MAELPPCLTGSQKTAAAQTNHQNHHHHHDHHCHRHSHRHRHGHHCQHHHLSHCNQHPQHVFTWPAPRCQQVCHLPARSQACQPSNEALHGMTKMCCSEWLQGRRAFSSLWSWVSLALLFSPVLGEWQPCQSVHCCAARLLIISSDHVLCFKTMNSEQWTVDCNSAATQKSPDVFSVHPEIILKEAELSAPGRSSCSRS